MAKRKPPAEEPEEKPVPEESAPRESSPAAGACVLVLLAGFALAVVFAVSVEGGVLAVWATGVGCVWWSARRRTPGLSAPPPPRGVPPSGDVFAGETTRIARVVPIAGGVGCILHPVREEVPPPA